MVDIYFEIDGKRVDPNKVGDALEKAMLQRVQEHIKKTVGAVRCPDHGSAPEIVCKGRNLDNLSFDIRGCCQKLIDVVKAKLGN